MFGRRYGSHLYNLFILLALCFSQLLIPSVQTTVFLALLILLWHVAANICCAAIASYRFKDPSARYIVIKNSALRLLLVRPFHVGRATSLEKHDTRTNILGLVLNVINLVLFAFFELLLLLPKIPCETHYFPVALSVTRRGAGSIVDLPLHSLNEIISAWGAFTFTLLVMLVALVFLALFEHQLSKLRRESNRTTPPKKHKRPLSPRVLKKSFKWSAPLYKSLVALSVCSYKKRRNFRYKPEQLREIEEAVREASKYAELQLTREGGKLVSFRVVDTLTQTTVFTGEFLQ